LLFLLRRDEMLVKSSSSEIVPLGHKASPAKNPESRDRQNGRIL
jgi:hypothetical protein